MVAWEDSEVEELVSVVGELTGLKEVELSVLVQKDCEGQLIRKCEQEMTM